MTEVLEIVEIDACEVTDTLAKKIDTMITHPIYNKRADADDIRFRIEDMEHIFENSMEALDKLARDLKYKAPGKGPDVKVFINLATDAFNEMIAKFSKIANEEEEDFGRPGRRRGTLTLYARRPQ